MTEFIIVFLPLFLFILLIIQTALLLTARQVVQYAAFCSARSAIVHATEENSDYLEKAKMAAVVACLPISPKFNGFSELPFNDYMITAVRTNLERLMPEEWGSLILKFPLAYLLTTVEILDPAETIMTENSVAVAQTDIEAKVTHYYSLRIPLINRLFFHSYWSLRLDSQNVTTSLSEQARQAIIPKLRAGLSSLFRQAPVPELPTYLLPITVNCVMTAEGS